MYFHNPKKIIMNHQRIHIPTKVYSGESFSQQKKTQGIHFPTKNNQQGIYFPSWCQVLILTPGVLFPYRPKLASWQGIHFPNQYLLPFPLGGECFLAVLLLFPPLKEKFFIKTIRLLQNIPMFFSILTSLRN